MLSQQHETEDTVTVWQKPPDAQQPFETPLSVARPPEAFFAILKRLRRRSPIRRLAERWFVQENTTGEEAQIQPALDILKRSSGSRWKEREAAAWMLGYLPLTPEQKQEAVTTLQAVAANKVKRDLRGRAFRWLGRALVISPIVLLLLIVLTNFHFYNVPSASLS